jgi:hypothetical protein
MLSPIAVLLSIAQPATIPHAVAGRIDSPPALDGRLDDPVWLTAPPTTSFTQKFPNEGGAMIDFRALRNVPSADVLLLKLSLLFA